jgi:hypothetical protein
MEKNKIRRYLILYNFNLIYNLIFNFTNPRPCAD